ncbi:MAG: NAD(P)-dependent alcohol dehydrogenase [Rhodothermia bacterium]|nr:NAD(P)-dependent alcohol dehydrogenase [Rhodothermia bacterium]
MRAFVATGYGPPEVLRLRDLPIPVHGGKEVLIKVYATTVTSGDWRIRSLEIPRGFKLVSRFMFGISRPRQPILGTEVAGRVESVGPKVTRFSPGDDVVAYSESLGCHAEYIVMSQDAAIAPKPATLSFEQAAALSFGGTTALQFLRRGNVRSQDNVLVNGASGAVGSAAVQLGKHFGAIVTGVCSTANVELVQSVGADQVIDYTRQDVASHGSTYDIIVDTVGTLPFSRSKNLLKQGGRLLVVLGTLSDLLQIPWVSITSNKKVIAGPALANVEDLQFLARLAEAGHFMPVIDRTYPFEQMVEAHRYVDKGHKRGNVVIIVDEDWKK